MHITMPFSIPPKGKKKGHWVEMPKAILLAEGVVAFVGDAEEGAE